MPANRLVAILIAAIETAVAIVILSTSLGGDWLKLRCKLKDLLESRGLTQLKVAEGASVTPGAVGRMCRNQLSRIDQDTIDKVTNYLGITDINEIFELAP